MGIVLLTAVCVVLALVAFASEGNAAATGVDALRLAPDGIDTIGDAGGMPTVDWLVKPVTAKAECLRSADGRTTYLTNGLVRRTLRIEPNAATVGYDNLMTGEALLRGVKPEAIIEIDGTRHEIGGLKGQPNYAYLLPEWVEGLRADPRAWRFTRLTVGRAGPRMEWKRVRRHAPDVKWPPEGVHLRMDYAPSVASALRDSRDGRDALVTDSFDRLEKAWRVRASGAHPRSSFENEGKIGEIYTPANTCVFVERPLPRQTRLVEVVIDVGTDHSASWGPGIALLFGNSIVKFNIRPGGHAGSQDPCFGIASGGGERFPDMPGGKLDLSRPVALRVRIEGNGLHCDARQGDGVWKTIDTLNSPGGDPTAVRIGKTDTGGGARDHGTAGDLVRLHVQEFAAYGPVDETRLRARTAGAPTKPAPVVSVHYEIYDGIPCISKWITVRNPTDATIEVNAFTSEILAVVEHSSPVELREGVEFPVPGLHVQTDCAFSGMTWQNANRRTVHWVPDPEYKTQVNYLRRTPCLLEVRPTLGPAQQIRPGGTFESFRAFELVYDSSERERRGMAVRRMFRTLAPWTTENPLMLHVRRADWNSVRSAIDQCVEVGFEMVILTFGSGFNIENDSDRYLDEMKRYADYAREKDLEIGGYSLLASRRVGGGNDVSMPAGKRPTFGNSPCLQSAWGQAYFKKLYRFYEKTGFMLLEHDGSYPGDECTSTSHPGHRGHADSRWSQWKMIADFYEHCRAQGIYLNVPDYYYLGGSNKCGMGYRETNWSLPRAQQVIHSRQNIYDGTWEKTPSMGWMFVPLTQYHGGGAAATIEPLDEHRDHYERMLYSNLALGVQACYRGPRIYDTDRTKALVKKWVNWFRKYRDILESDLVHGRRADGRDLDWMLHVNPRLEHKGMLVVFNPLPERARRTLTVKLYYTGLTERARIRRGEGAAREYRLSRDYTVRLPVEVDAQGFSWYVIE